MIAMLFIEQYIIYDRGASNYKMSYILTLLCFNLVTSKQSYCMGDRETLVPPAAAAYAALSPYTPSSASSSVSSSSTYAARSSYQSSSASSASSSTASRAIIPATGTIPSLQELCAKTLKRRVDWRKRPLQQVAQIYNASKLEPYNASSQDNVSQVPEKEGDEDDIEALLVACRNMPVSKGIPDVVWHQISTTLIAQGMQQTSCIPLLHDAISRNADGSIGLLATPYKRKKYKITIIDDQGIIGSFLEKKPLEQAILSLDGRYVLTSKNKPYKGTDKQYAYLKIWESQHQTCLSHYRFSEALQKISCVDDTDHIVLKVDDKTQFFTTIQSLLKRHRGIVPQDVDLRELNTLRFFSLEEATQQAPPKFYDTTTGVWRAKNSKNFFRHFIDLASSFDAEHHNPSYIHINPSGSMLAQGDSNGVITLWDLEQKQIVATHHLDHEEPINHIAWRTHDNVIALTSQHRYQFDIRDLLVGLFLEKAIQQVETLSTST